MAQLCRRVRASGSRSEQGLKTNSAAHGVSQRMQPAMASCTRLPCQVRQLLRPSKGRTSCQTSATAMSRSVHSMLEPRAHCWRTAPSLPGCNLTKTGQAGPGSLCLAGAWRTGWSRPPPTGKEHLQEATRCACCACPANDLSGFTGLCVWDQHILLKPALFAQRSCRSIRSACWLGS